MSRPKVQREIAGYRIEAQFKRRIEALADHHKCSTRTIIEQLLEQHLPEMERQAGLLPAGQGENKTRKGY